MANFLDGLNSALQAAQTIGSLFGPNKEGVLNKKNFQAQQDQLDLNNANQINRDTSYLKGMIPAQSEAYNQYQDATFTQDTNRMTDRIQDMGETLGMSPWELTGQSTPNTPVASIPSQTANSSNVGMGAGIPLQIAKLNAATALAQTQMNNETQLKMNDKSTAGGKVPVSQSELNAAQTILAQQNTKTNKAQEDLTWTQSAAAENNNILAMIQQLAKFAGETTIQIGPYSRTSQNNAGVLRKIYTDMLSNKSLPNGGADQLSDLIKNLPADQWEGLKSDLQRISKLIIQNAEAAGEGTGRTLVEGLGGFLKGITGAGKRQ